MFFSHLTIDLGQFSCTNSALKRIELALGHKFCIKQVKEFGHIFLVIFLQKAKNFNKLVVRLI